MSGVRDGRPKTGEAMLSEEALLDAVRERVDIHERCPGMVVGVVSAAGRTVHPYGALTVGGGSSGVGLYAMGVLVVLLAAIKLTFDPRQIWQRLEWQR